MDTWLNEIQPDIIIITEHGMSDKDIRYIKLSNYSLKVSYCRKDFKGGGVAIFVSFKLKDNQTSEICVKSIDKIFEVVGFKIITVNKVFKIFGIYRSPSAPITDFLLYLETLIGIQNGNNVNLVFAGDFNINLDTTNRDYIKMLDILNANNLRDIIKQYTRVTATSSTTIDHIVTNILECDITYEVINSYLSDHYAQILHIKIDSKNEASNTIQEFRHIAKHNIDKLILYLNNETWDQVFQVTSIEDKWSRFYNIFLNYFDKSCPLVKKKQKTMRKKPLTLDFETTLLRNKVKDFYLLYKSLGSIYYQNKYKNAIKEYQCALSNLRSLQFANKFQNSSNKSKTAWCLINTYRNEHKHIENLGFDLENCTVNDPLAICKELNSFFLNVSLNHSKPTNTGPQNDINFNNHTLFLTPTTESELIDIVKKFTNKYSSGWDEISPVLLKACIHVISHPLTYLINASIKEGIFPDCLKISIVRPIYKKGDKRQMNNYRPITLTSAISKLFEKVILKRLDNFLSKYDILTNTQHGFRKGFSTISAVTTLIHEVMGKLNDNLKIASLSLDLSKAFDCVNHQLLLNKIESYGIRGVSYRLISSFLKGRIQCTEIAHKTGSSTKKYRSDFQEVTIGVPQGSVLGPVLFILYINDLPRSNYFINNTYADDTNILCWNNSLSNLLQSISITATLFEKYFASNNLSMNKDKTKIIIFELSNRLKLEDCNNWEHLSMITGELSFLGVQIDSRLCWDKHINNICNKLSKVTYLFKVIRHYVNDQIMELMYYGLIFPHLNYGIEVWGSAANIHTNRMFLLQKKIIRLMYKMKYTDSCRTIFRSKRIFTIYSLFVYKVVLLVAEKPQFRIKNSDIHMHNTRNRNDFHIKSTNKNKIDHDPYIIGSIMYNKLPPSIKVLTGNLFKKNLKEFLISKSLYTLNEF